MRRPIAWICLCLALAGPFVVQARVARGMAMARADAGKNLFESGENAAEEAFDGRDHVAVTAQDGPVIDGRMALDLAILPTLPGIGIEDAIVASVRRAGPWQWPPPDAGLRQSLLQVFRF